jgi:hypothetical protein
MKPNKDFPRCLNVALLFWNLTEEEKAAFCKKENVLDVHPLIFATLQEDVRGVDDKPFTIKAGDRVRIVRMFEDDTFGIFLQSKYWRPSTMHHHARVTLDKLAEFSYNYKYEHDRPHDRIP